MEALEKEKEEATAVEGAMSNREAQKNDVEVASCVTTPNPPLTSSPKAYDDISRHSVFGEELSHETPQMPKLTHSTDDLAKEKEDATDVEDAMSEREAQLDDIEVASCVTTPNPPLTSSPKAYDDISRHSVFGEELSHETPQMPKLTHSTDDLAKEKEDATDVEVAMSEREAQLDDIEVASCVTTPNPPLTSRPNAYDDISRHSVFVEELSHETPQMPKLTRSTDDLAKEKEDATDVEDAMSEREAQLDDIEVASCVTTPNPPLTSRPNAYDDISRHSVFVEELSHETPQMPKLTRSTEDLVKEKEDATDVEVAMSEREAQLDDIEVASCVTTPNPSLSACPNTYDDISSHSAFSEELSHETTQLLRQLNAGRQLPEHLTGKRVQQNLRAALTKQSITKRLRWQH